MQRGICGVTKSCCVVRACACVERQIEVDPAEPRGTRLHVVPGVAGWTRVNLGMLVNLGGPGSGSGVALTFLAILSSFPTALRHAEHTQRVGRQWTKNRFTSIVGDGSSETSRQAHRVRARAACACARTDLLVNQSQCRSCSTRIQRCVFARHVVGSSAQLRPHCLSRAKT